MKPLVIGVAEMTGDDDEVFIGRPSKWGNPWAIGHDGDRDRVIDRYDRWLDTQPELLAAIPELTGKVLVCFCKPARCHGDVLVRRWEEAHPVSSVGSGPMATTPSNDPSADEYDDLAAAARILIAGSSDPESADDPATAALASLDAIVGRCREAEGLIRLALPHLSKLARIERIIEGNSASPGLVAVGGQAKAIVKVMDAYGEKKRGAVARPTKEG